VYVVLIQVGTHILTIRNLSKGIFEQCDANQRWGLFPFNTLYASTVINASKILIASKSLFSYRDNLLENLGKLHVLPKNARSPCPFNVCHSRTPLPKLWKRILGRRNGVVVKATAFHLASHRNAMKLVLSGRLVACSGNSCMIRGSSHKSVYFSNLLKVVVVFFLKN